MKISATNDRRTIIGPKTSPPRSPKNGLALNSSSSLATGSNERSCVATRSTTLARSIPNGMTQPLRCQLKPKITLRKALSDRELLGSALGGDSWANWRAMLLAANGEPLEPAELSAFREFTGRVEPPSTRVDELWRAIGRRGGKPAQWLRLLPTTPDYAITAIRWCAVRKGFCCFAAYGPRHPAQSLADSGLAAK